MKPKLTKKQALILEFITEYSAREHESPTYREIMSALGLSSVSAVAEHVENLVAKGVLRKSPGAARSLELVDLSYPETTALFRDRLLHVDPASADILWRAAEILGLDLGDGVS